MNGKSDSNSSSLLHFVVEEEVPVEELTCQFIMDETSQCVPGGLNFDDINNKRISQAQQEQQLHKEMMVDGSIIRDSLLVDQKEIVQEGVLNGNTDKNHRMISAEAIATRSSSLEVVEDQASPELQVGDHVYQWRSLVGIPWVFQHHGIVMDVIRGDDVSCDDDGDGKMNSKPIVKLVIADFSNVETKNQKKKEQSKSERRPQQQQQQQQTMSGDGAWSRESSSLLDQRDISDTQHDDTKTSHGNNGDSRRSSSTRLSLEQEGIMRTYTDTDKWQRVDYESSWLKRQVYRSGTCTKAKSDPVGLVLARVHFIIQNPHLLPDYHVVHANCECVAFWCKTGRWSTLQASTFLELTAAGQVKSSATLAAAAAGATQTVTVPGTISKIHEMISN